MNLTLDEDLDKRFREAVSQKLGFKKGNLQVAVEEALEDWVKKHSKTK